HTIELDTRIPARELVRAGPDELTGPVGLASEAIWRGRARFELLKRDAQDVLRKGRKVSSGPAPQAPRVRKWELPPDQKGLRVGRHHFLDAVDRRARRLAEVRYGVHAPGEHEIIHRKKGAVVPGHIGPQTIGRFHMAVGGNAPAVGIQLRERLSQVWLRDSLSVAEAQSRVEKTSRGGRGGLCLAERFLRQRVRLPSHQDGERARWRARGGLTRRR